MLGELHATMWTLARQLRALPGVETAEAGVTPLRYEVIDRVQAYVTSVLSSGNMLDCWLEFGRDSDGWIIESALLRQTDRGSEVLVEFAERHFESDERLPAELEEAVHMMAEAALGLDYESL